MPAGSGNRQRVGGVPDLIVDGRNGLLVASGDIGELAGAMERMWNSPELRTQLISGWEELTAEYSPAYQRRKLIEVYEDVFGEKDGGCIN